MARLPALLLGAGLTGCLPRGGDAPEDADAPTIAGDNPILVSYERTCNVDDGEWFVRAETENWAGGLFTWWSVDGRVVENHAIPVAESDPDGGWDIMRKALPIVTDWREAVDGSSTRFRCAEEVTVRYWIENTRGQRVICGTDGEGLDALDALDRIAPCP